MGSVDLDLILTIAKIVVAVVDILA